jgi:hypothetical protein
MFLILCIESIRKRETASCIHYAYVLDCVYQKEEKCIIYRIYVYSIGKREHYIIPKLCLWSSTLYIRKKETASYLQSAYDLCFVYHIYENCIIPTVCLVSRLCVFERRNVHHSNIIGRFWQIKIKGNCFPIWVVEMETNVSYMKLVIGVAAFACKKTHD